MIQKLSVKNFRNFVDKDFHFEDDKNFIIGENGHGKTNILEALSLFSPTPLSHLDFDTLIHKQESFFRLEVETSNGDILGLYYERENKKKTYSIQKKNCSKKKLLEQSYGTVNFSPIVMNMLYLGPSLRRDFLDEVCRSSFPAYDTLFKNYKNIVKNRNRILKSIAAGNSEVQELNFWDQSFIRSAVEVYGYRFQVCDYIAEKLPSYEMSFGGEQKSCSFKLITKVDSDNIENDLKSYLEKNRQRDIIIGKTHIGPHVDDFEIMLTENKLTDFASRGEVKSVIIALKLIESAYITQQTDQTPLLLIDDLLSELDDIHRDMLTSSIGGQQSCITSIYDVFEAEGVIRL